MNWTSKQPKKPGWYWCRNWGDRSNEVWVGIARIERSPSGELFASWMTAPGEVGTAFASEFSDIAKWCGPVKPPEFDL